MASISTASRRRSPAAQRPHRRDYKDPAMDLQVVTERANIELMFNDTYWDCHGFVQSYPWEVVVFNVTRLVRGFHPSEYETGGPWAGDDPYAFAKKHGLPTDTLDDYLAVINRLLPRSQRQRGSCASSARWPTPGLCA